MAAFQLFLDSQPDQVQPGFILVQRVIQRLNHLRRDREGNAFVPKFFSSHGSFFIHTLLTATRI